MAKKYDKYHIRKIFWRLLPLPSFDKVDENSNDEKKLLFTKNGHSIPIDLLSTGEKQIVFRGAYLLKNGNSISGGTVLIDEPELSMHPKWQQKILKYYQDLFNKNEQQTVQLFAATHSEYVISSGLQDRENTIVIVLSENGGIINEEPRRKQRGIFVPRGI